MRVWLGALAGAAAMITATIAAAQPVGMIENAYKGQVAARMKAPLGKTDLFRTHEVPRIKAVLDTMRVF